LVMSHVLTNPQGTVPPPLLCTVPLLKHPHQFPAGPDVDTL
jgi:hypothetical protein